ncbi:MAG: hypothetical protein PHQ02_01470 [Candidatus Riflebacteria bacterium]|nr:hypothetical protein [Candidatus Riflebacteria bacterium]
MNKRAISTEVFDEYKIRRTVGTFCCFVVNSYLMYILKVPLGSNAFLFFNLLSLVAIVYSIVKKDFSILFLCFGLSFVPFIIMQAGLSLIALLSFFMAILSIFFFKNLDLNYLSEKITGVALLYDKASIKKRIIKLSGSNISSESIEDNDISEFTEVQKELDKFKRACSKESDGIKRAISKSIHQVENLQKDHARVLVRTVGLREYLNSINTKQIQNEIDKLLIQLKETEDGVLKSQIESTIKMKQTRLSDLNTLKTSLGRIMMQKVQMKEMFSGLMGHMNTLKFTDVIGMEASSDSMVKEVELIRSGLVDLENGLAEVEKRSKQAIQ